MSHQQDHKPGRGLTLAKKGLIDRVPVITDLPSRSSTAARTSGRFCKRHVTYVAAGTVIGVRRASDAATHKVARSLVIQAVIQGDREAAEKGIDRLRLERDHKLKRAMDLPMAILGYAIGAATALAVVVVAILLAALAAQILPGGRSGMDVFRFVWWLFNLAGIIVEAVALGVVFGGPVVLVWWCWREGRRAGAALGWKITAEEGGVDERIDEGAISRALAGLRIPAITEYQREGGALQFVQMAHRDGRGVAAIVRLPLGVNAERVVTRRSELAAGLYRSSREVWPLVGDSADLLALWVADRGALAEGAGPHPLLESGDVDIFKGVPFGRTLRGAPVLAPIMERNTMCGGMPGQGKSSAARVIMAGAALDPTVELRIWVPDINFDFQVFERRCSRFVVGAEDEHIATILEDLRTLHAEVQHRGRLLVEHETPSVTRRLASAGVGLHPVVCLLEEAHVAIQDSAYGKDIAQLLIDIVKLGRKRGIHMIVSTQAPTRDSMPRDVTRNCSNGIAYAVGDHVANDALLGQGAYAAGHRATELIPGTDRGTAIVKGFDGERSQAVQGYFLDVSKDNDQVTPIIDRSLSALEEKGRGVPGAGRPTVVVEKRDLLDDLDEVLDIDPVKAADVPGLLRTLAPNWAPYKALTGKGLREQLDALGVRVPSTNNRWPVDPAAVRTALARRATADLDEEALA